MPSSVADRRLPAIVARDVSKTFRVPEDRVYTLKERVLHPRRNRGYQRFHVLNDISFAVEEGEFFGIAGRNGSGKSTLLKCLAGIYRTEGDIWRRGRLSTLIELGVGFNPELPARDNVILNGLMMGLTPREARARYDAVIDFAELAEFRDLKLKNYSSGMHIRLAFSVAIQVDAEVLLVDEILAVGDASFQQKCFDVFHRLRREGKTIVFVTHDMSAMKRFCNRALLLERGSMVHLGDPEDVAERYLEINFGRDPQPESSDGHAGDGEARVLEVWAEDEHGQRKPALPQGQRITLRVLVRFHVGVEHPQASVYIHNDEQKTVLIASTVLEHDSSGVFGAGEQVLFSFTFENILAPGRYSPVVALSHRGEGLDVMDRYESGFSFLVTGVSALGGMVDVPVEVAVQSAEATLAQELPA